ncbi:FK506-binding protein 5-like isoform X3 [Sinocyclocheilus anshuiensis]|uniref:FK506-binding protein 5-like isoform X3 n=1 Tax=Sinocyclocheilus anshuiensis TaxID=1608454 RepID=UPI0007B9A482|nr:PREDICTED: FK506-binding protein 5-like isoform X3 [Sinocyclocheilus anshuiensis]
MTKRKGKGTNKQDDSLLLLETPSVTPPRGFKEYAVPAIVFFIFAVGGSTAVWFCSQQQQTIDSLTETVNAMQLRITKFQQQLGMGNAQIANVGVFEERLQALEEAYTQAQKKADVALATSEKIKSTDLQNQFWSLQSEMNGKLSELQQESVSTATLNAVVKNKTEETETLKQRLNSILTANSEVAVTISGLTDTVLVTKSRLDEQMSTTEGLTSELEEQRMELSSLKESFISNKKALERNRQEVMDIKDLLEMEQARRSQVLEEQLMAVRRSLEDHQKSTHSLHSHLAAQLEIVQSQMLSESQQSSSEENIPVEEQQVKQAATQEEVPIKDEEVETKEQAITEEETVEEVHDEERERVVPEEDEPAEDVQVHGEEPVEKQADKNKIPEEAEVKEDVAEEQAVTEENEQADEVPFHQDIIEEAVTQQDEMPEELQVSDKEVPVEEVQVLGEEESVENQVVTEEDVITEEVEVNDGDVIEEQAVTEGDVISEEVQVNDGDVIEEQVVTEEDVITEEVEVNDEDVIEEQAVTEGDAISEEVQVNDGYVIEERAVTEGDEITEEIPDQEEEAVLDKEDPTSMEETGTDTSVAEAVENFSEDQVVEDISQEQTSQEPLEETEKQKDLEEFEEHVQYSEEEEEEPAEEIVEELDEKDISTNGS